MMPRTCAHTHASVLSRSVFTVPPPPSLSAKYPAPLFAALQWVTMCLPQLLWYLGYADTLRILIGCQLMQGWAQYKREGKEGENKGNKVDPSS